MPPATAQPNQPQFYGPSETALLFLDYQNVLFSMITDESVKKSVLDSAKTLLASARQNKVPIIHCLIVTKLDPPPTSKIYEQWSTIHKPLLEANLDLAKEHPDLAPNGSATGHESTSLRVPGPRSALLNKDLITTLRKELSVTSLILGGIATSGAIIGTALQGIDEDFVVTVVRDAVWDPNSQVTSHLLDVVLPVSGYVVSTSEAVSFMQPKC